MTTDRAAMLLEDTRAAPASLAALVAAYEAPDGPLAGIGDVPRRVLLTGLGSSRYAALLAESTFRAAEIETVVAHASGAATEELPSARGERDAEVVIAISASGRTPEVLEVAQRSRGRRRVIGVTNVPRSPLGDASDAVLRLCAPVERSGVASLTFRATLAVLALVAEQWRIGHVDARGRLGFAVAALQDLLAGMGAAVDGAVDLLDGAAAIDVLAPAPALGLAEQAALMLRECPRLPAFASETADWLHTGVYLAYPGHRAVLFTGSASDADVVATIARRGGATVAVGDQVEGAALHVPVHLPADPLVRALVTSVVAEGVAARLWQRANAIDKVP